MNAYEMPAGRIVAANLNGAEVLCLKAERPGKDFVNHYLVPLAPLPCALDLLALVYVDPVFQVADRSSRYTLALCEPAPEPAVGHVLQTAAGRFLKVHDTAKAQRSFAYVDLATGEIRRRQERGEVLAWSWRIEERV